MSAVTSADSIRLAGLIEAIAPLAPGVAFISGWSRTHPTPGEKVRIATRQRTSEGRLWALWNDRADVGAGNCFCGILLLGEGLEAGDIEAVLLPDGKTLTLYDGLNRLEPAQGSALLRHAIIGAPDDGVRRRLQEYTALYDGTDTVNTAPLPIRIGIDDCVGLDGGFVFLRGWLFDPEHLVECVSLVEGETTQRLDDGWIGLARPDVSAEMRRDPRFSAYEPPHDIHGFAVLRHVGETPANLHLTIEVAGQGSLHLPLGLRTGNGTVLLRQLARAIDPDAPGTLSVAERLIAPALAAHRAKPPSIDTASAPPSDKPGPVTLVIGCSGDCNEVAALLHIVAGSKPFAAMPIIIAADARELSAYDDEIAARAAFLGLRLQRVACHNAADALDTISAAASIVRTPAICATTVSRLPALLGSLKPSAAARLPSGLGALFFCAPGQSAVEPPPIDSMLAKTELFVKAGAFPANRLTSPGKWSALHRRLSTMKPAPRIECVPTAYTSTPQAPVDRSADLLNRIDAFVAAIETAAADD